MNAHQVTRDFEAAIGEYTGAPHVVCVNSCTMALLLAVAWHVRKYEADKWAVGVVSQERAIAMESQRLEINIPARTYVGVPMSIIHAGGQPTFRDEDWLGYYQLKPLPVWDSARWFSRGMYGANEALINAPLPFSMNGKGHMACVSFHATKTLGIEQGGAILLDDPVADAWLRQARFDGRQTGVAPKDQKDWTLGWHCYINPSTAAQGLMRMAGLPRHNAPLPNDDYPDLSKMEIFK